MPFHLVSFLPLKNKNRENETIGDGDSILFYLHPCSHTVNNDFQVVYETSTSSQVIFDASLLTPRHEPPTSDCFAGEMVNLSLTRIKNTVADITRNIVATPSSQRILVYPIEYSNESPAFDRALNGYSDSNCATYTIENIFLRAE